MVQLVPIEASSRRHPRISRPFSPAIVTPLERPTGPIKVFTCPRYPSIHQKRLKTSHQFCVFSLFTKLQVCDFFAPLFWGSVQTSVAVCCAFSTKDHDLSDIASRLISDKT